MCVIKNQSKVCLLKVLIYVFSGRIPLTGSNSNSRLTLFRYTNSWVYLPTTKLCTLKNELKFNKE